jgi:hypothetical protein
MEPAHVKRRPAEAEVVSASPRTVYLPGGRGPRDRSVYIMSQLLFEPRVKYTGLAGSASNPLMMMRDTQMPVVEQITLGLKRATISACSP